MAVWAMKENISINRDGFTVEFYKKSQHLLVEHLHGLFLACLNEKKLPMLWSLAKLFFFQNKIRF